MTSVRDPAKLYPFDYLLKYTIIPLIPRWITPNQITLLRIICVPIVAWLLSVENYNVGIPVFILVAFSDAIDGALARLRHQITAWGTFYDPVADKLLISVAVLIIVMKHINPIFGFIIIGIEVAIMIGGYINRRNGRPRSANLWGKIKMFLQFAGVTLLMLAVWSGATLFVPFSIGLLSLAIVFAVISLYTYGL
ncbi:MAG: CDP-alcohol phosphatidyltransferase family protein [Patescibacteria group bacterium]